MPDSINIAFKKCGLLFLTIIQFKFNILMSDIVSLVMPQVMTWLMQRKSFYLLMWIHNHFKTILHQRRMHGTMKKKQHLWFANSIVHKNEQEKGTISDIALSTLLKQQHPNIAIYSHQLDYCEFRLKVKRDPRSSIYKQSAVWNRVAVRSPLIFKKLKTRKQN